MKQKRNSKEIAAVALALLLATGFACGLRAQDISFGNRSAAARRDHVTVVSDEAFVDAGKPQVVELRFRVEEGYHINSHTPRSEFLIPTTLNLNAPAGIKVLGMQYPTGSSFRLTVGDGETLDVYQGEFRVDVHIVAPRGLSTLGGTLRYQACDNAACFPPRNVPVRVAITAR